MTDTARIPTFEPCQHRWVSRTLKWCPDCDLVQALDSDVWAAGWGSGWTEHGFRLRQQLTAAGATSHVMGIVNKALAAINEDVMPT